MGRVDDRMIDMISTAGMVTCTEVPVVIFRYCTDLRFEDGVIEEAWLAFLLSNFGAVSICHCGCHRGAAFTIEPSYACLVFEWEKFGSWTWEGCI